MIETERLLIRKMEPTDIKFIHKGLSDPEVTRYYAVHFPTIEATKEQMDWYADLEQQGTGQWFVIVDKMTKELVGAGGYNSLEKEHRKAEIGFWLLPEFWGKGFMSEAMFELFRYGFEEMNLHRIEGYVDSLNEKCKKAVAKVGFVYEGTMKDCEWKNGTFLSVDIFAKFNPKV